MSDELTKQLVDADRQKGGEKKKDLLTGSELRKKAREVKTKKKGERIKSAKLEKKHQQQIIEASNNHRNKILLENGTLVQSPEGIIQQIEKSCVYMYPKMFREIIDEEDDDYDNLRGVSTTKDNTNISTINDDTTVIMPTVEDFGALCAEKEGWRAVLTRSMNSLLPESSTATFRVMTSKQEKLNYFVTCLAAQFVSLSSYEPVDMTSYLTGYSWHDAVDEVLISQYEALKQAMENWDPKNVSLQTVIGHKPIDNGKSSCISYHDGKHIGILTAAMCAFHVRSLTQREESQKEIFKHLSKDAEDAIERYINRDIEEYKILVSKIIQGKGIKDRGKATKELMKLSVVMKCNIQEIHQGFQSFFETQDEYQMLIIQKTNEEGLSKLMELRHKYHQLAQYGHAEFYDGVYATIRDINKLSGVSFEETPLKDAHVLRRYFDLQLPMMPWLENYGRLIGSHPMLDLGDKMTVTKHILHGCESKNHKIGYLRALRGLSETIDLQSINLLLDKHSQKILKSPDVRYHLDLNEESFLIEYTAKVTNYLLS